MERRGEGGEVVKDIEEGVGERGGRERERERYNVHVSTMHVHVYGREK